MYGNATHTQDNKVGGGGGWVGGGLSVPGFVAENKYPCFPLPCVLFNSQ